MDLNMNIMMMNADGAVDPWSCTLKSNTNINIKSQHIF